MVVNGLGQKVPDPWAANNNISSNWYFLFTTQSIQYLLGNGVTFAKADTKKKLGKDFDRKIQEIALYAKNGSTGFGFWNLDHIDVFPYTQFVPLYDEESSDLKVGIRFWQLDKDKPLRVTLYELDGYTDYIQEKNGIVLKEKNPKRSYKIKVSISDVDGEQEEQENYNGFPIIPLENIRSQSDIVGMKQAIDAYDLAMSSLVNNSTQYELVYWVIKNCGGFESDLELEEVVSRIIKNHVIAIDDQSDATPHKIEPPFAATEATLVKLETQLYRDNMALKIEDISAGNKTATEIKAAYELLNQKSDLFEYQVTQFINQILQLAGIDDEPSYSRSSIANAPEEIQTLLSADQYIDDETMIKKIASLLGIPNEAHDIMKRLATEETSRFNREEETEYEGSSSRNNR